MKTNLTISIPVWLDRVFAAPILLYRRLRFGYPYRRIYLGEGKYTIVDPPDFYRFNKFHWCLKQNGPRIYAVRLICDSNNKTKILSLHREILNAPAHLLVDHANRYTLDNRQANLRLATHSENQFNKGKTRSNTSSKFVGVFLEKRTDKWIARIVFNKKRLWLGRFNSELDAAKAYDDAAKKYHGEFARLNFP